jgi:RecQ mediated genome instability protein
MSCPDEVVHRQLQSIAGVIPSHHWYRSCIKALQLQTYNIVASDSHSLATHVMDQILYHDLRNVVRSITGEQNNAQSIALRDAIRQSMNAETGYKSVLSQSFRLLVQVEEYVDAASNIEKRMETINDTSSMAPTQACSPPLCRCIKFCYSDGYTNLPSVHDNQTTSNANRPTTSPNMFVAMEVSPLDGLGSQYQLVAGLKVLLHGPIIIRHGVAGWHSGCATIFGGYVEQLVEIQRRALIYAKKESGSGVDPTVKALVRNNPSMAIENEVDGKIVSFICFAGRCCQFCF